MPQSFSWNAYESGLASPITDAATTIALDSTLGLRAPGYLVIEPESPTHREYIYFATLNGSTLENVSRGLGGSVAGGIAHDAGVTVRAVAMHQMFDDLWTDIGAGDQLLSDHIDDPGDPHAAAGYLKESEANLLYVELTGDLMTGLLVLSGDPVDPLGAVTKQYVDTGLTDHTAIEDAHHTRYTDGEAIAAVGDPGDGVYLPLLGGTMLGDIDMSNRVLRNVARVELNFIKPKDVNTDIIFQDFFDSLVGHFDVSDDKWKFLRDTEFSNDVLVGRHLTVTNDVYADRGIMGEIYTTTPISWAVYRHRNIWINRPSPDPAITGDLWFDQDSNQVLAWSGSAWVVIIDGDQ